MNPPRFKDDLIRHLLALLHDRQPALVERVLERAGFRDGDVTFRKTQRGQTWTEINRWPWEKPLVVREATGRVCLGTIQTAPSNAQCLACGLYGQRCERTGAKPEPIDALIERSSLGAALRDIKERGIDAHLVDLEREMTPKRRRR